MSFFATVGKKNKTTGGLTVKGVAWDTNVGGRDFDQVCASALCVSALCSPPASTHPRERALACVRDVCVPREPSVEPFVRLAYHGSLVID